MIFTLDEMNVLSEKLEKEKVQLHERVDVNTENRDDYARDLFLISSIQQKLRDRVTSFSEDERKLLSRLVRDEMHHIHGDEPGTYQSILNKVEQNDPDFR